MPLPRITSAIVAATRPVIPGWTLVELADVPRSNPGQKSGVNYFFEFNCIQGPNNSSENKDKKFTVLISGTMLENQHEDTCMQYAGILSSLTGVSPDNLISSNVNEEALVGKRFWGEIVERIVEGKVYRGFRAFAPEGEIPF